MDSRGLLTSYFWSGDAMRSRSVGNAVLTATVEVPVPPARLLADWERETSSRMDLEPGNVEEMPLARTRVRWPEFNHCVQAMSEWTRLLGLHDVLASSDIALMACRGANYHHDGEQYGGAAFCNVFLSEDKGLDLHFPFAGLRIPLVRGTAVLFDTCQPHAVIQRGSSGFDAADFVSGQDWTQIFLTWELPVEHDDVARALGVAFDIDASIASRLDEEQVWMNGTRVSVCPKSGQWQRADEP
jgi:hypothetical protein